MNIDPHNKSFLVLSEQNMQTEPSFAWEGKPERQSSQQM